MLWKEGKNNNFHISMEIGFPFKSQKIFKQEGKIFRTNQVFVVKDFMSLKL